MGSVESLVNGGPVSTGVVTNLGEAQPEIICTIYLSFSELDVIPADAFL